MTAGEPRGMRVQTPSADAPCAIEQAEQTPVQLLSQQRPSVQKPLAQSLARLQTAPCGRPTQKPLWQMPLVQSAPAVQRLPVAHGAQVPPQSTSVSPKSCSPSRQCDAQPPPTQTRPAGQSTRTSGPF